MSNHQNRPYQGQLSRLEALTPILLTVHGMIMLLTLGGKPWAWFFVVSTGIMGIVSLKNWQTKVDLTLLRASLLFAISTALIFLTGTTNSYFLLWYFVIVAVYPIVLKPPASVALSILISSIYFLSALFSEGLIPHIVVGARSFLLLFISLVTQRLGTIFSEYIVERDTLIHQASDGIFISDLDGNYMEVNENGCLMLGCTREEILQMNIRDLVVPEPTPVPLRLDELKEGKTILSERNLHHKDGRSIPVEISSRMIGGKRLLGIVRDITERRQAEEELRQSEERYRKLINNARDVIFTISRDGRITSLNPAFEIFTGWSREEWLDRQFDELVAENDRARAHDQFEAILRGETLRALRLRMHTRSGEILVVEMNISPQFKDKQVAGLLGIARDMTQEQQVEDALKASELRFRSLVEHSVDQISLLTRDGSLLYENPTILRPLGYPRDTFLGRSLFELVHPDDLDRARQTWKQVLDQPDSSTQTVFRLRHANGSWRWMEGTATNMLSEPAVQAVVLNYRDITERKQAEMALRQSEERLNEAQRLAKVGSWSFDPSDDRLIWSPNMFTLLNMDPSEAPTFERFLNVVSAEDRVRVGDGFQEFLASSRTEQEVEYRIRLENEDVRHIEAMGKAERDAAGRVVKVTGTVQDITERKRAGQERENLITELTAKNAELEHFIYTVSHDLKSPLVTIKGFLGYLEQDAVSGNVERIKDDIQRISNAVEKMQELLGNLLELSRIGRFINPPEKFPFDELASEAIGLVEGQILERGVRVDLQPDLPLVYGDKLRLLEVLQNLLDNAVKYMGDQAHPHIEIGLRNEDLGSDHPIFFVRDNGIGIAPEYHERIFGLFNKLDATSDGTGVGLALVKRIIELHDGRVWVESELGQGSTFYFTLPTV